MTKLKTLSISLVAILGTLGVSSMAQAATKGPHSIGVQLAGGGAEYKNSKQDGDGAGSIYFHYNYNFSDMLALEVGLNSGGDAEVWKCKDTKDKLVCDKQTNKLFNLAADDFKYGNLVVAAKGQYALTERNSLYGKLGANFYDYEINNGKNKLASDDGIGLFAEAGWQYQWDNGVAVKAGYQLMNMGDLKVSGTTLGVSYQF